jgi:HlyD family secretion protein
MKRIVVLLLLLGVAGGGLGLWWWLRERERAPRELVLYGNVDLRQVQLAFNNSERIAAVFAQEGDRVRKGQPLARLDTSRIEPQVAEAEGQVEAQRSYVQKLHNGNRPQEKAQARANVASVEADLVKARQQYDRLKKLALVRLNDGSEVRAVSQEDVDNAKAALDVAAAKVAVNQKALDLMLAGFRKEEVAQAEAQLRVNEAKLALLQQQLADAQLLAPTEAIVRTRLMEPGEMSSPQKPVFSLAIIDPKWVRAYVSETDLGKLRPRMAASVTVDSFPNRQFDGWVGFISPVAEFTPKTVQTEELRTSLVYEVRVFVKDPGDELRLGMPATVRLPDQKTGSAAGEDK